MNTLLQPLKRPSLHAALAVVVAFVPLWWWMAWLLAESIAGDTYVRTFQVAVFWRQFGFLCGVGAVFGALLSLTYLFVRDPKTPRRVYNESLLLQTGLQLVLFLGLLGIGYA